MLERLIFDTFEKRVYMKRRLTAIALLFVVFTSAQESITYQKPSAEIMQLADFERAPSVFMDSKREIYYLLTILVPMLLVIYCNDNKKYNADEAFKLIGMTFLVGTVFHKFLEIREESLMLFIYLFLSLLQCSIIFFLAIITPLSVSSFHISLHIFSKLFIICFII